MSLYEVDPKTGTHIEMPYQMMDANGVEIANDQNEKAAVLYNPRRGFLLATLTNDRLICRARLTIVNEEGGNDEVKQQDNNIIIQYTSKFSECEKITVDYVN